MSDTDVSWRWDFVVFRLCNQNTTLSQRQIDVKYWCQPDFHFQPKCNVCPTSCPTSTWHYIDVWCLLGSVQRKLFLFCFFSKCLKWAMEPQHPPDWPHPPDPWGPCDCHKATLFLAARLLPWRWSACWTPWWLGCVITGEELKSWGCTICVCD